MEAFSASSTVEPHGGETPEPEELKRAFHSVVGRIKAKDAVLGESLYLLGTGPVPVDSSVGGAIALTRDGGVVFIAALTGVSHAGAADVNGQLDRIAQLSPTALREAEPAPSRDEDLFARHARFFGRQDRATLNATPRAIVLLPRKLEAHEWDIVRRQLGPRLAGTFLTTTTRVIELQMPEEQADVPEPLAEVAPETPSRIANWIGIATLALGVVLAILGIRSALSSDEEPAPAPAAGNIQTVATQVSSDATHSRWIGQQRVVRARDGRLFVVYSSSGILQISSDQANQGESWSVPSGVAGITPISFSVDMDDGGRMHVAYSNGSSISYALLKQTKTGWRSQDTIVLDKNTSSLNVDIAWDEKTGTTHVVWARQTEGGEAPAWAVLATDGNKAAQLDSATLAKAGTDVPVLAAVDTDGRSNVLVTYRAGDRPEGWFSREGRGAADGGWTWQPEEEVPTTAFVGAVDVVYDAEGTAHLVLRDSSNFLLAYYTKKAQRRWSSGEVAVDADEVEHIDFPILSLDSSSGAVYLFFQTNEFVPNSEVRVALRDAAEGWRQPLQLLAPDQAPEGAVYPVAPADARRRGMVMWTKEGEMPEIQATLVSPS